MINVIAYVKDANQSKLILEKLNKVKEDLEFNYQIINVTETVELQKKYLDTVPFLKIGPYSISGDFEEPNLRMTIMAAQDRDRQLNEIGDDQYKKRLQSGSKITGLDKFSLWISKKYIWLMIFFLSLYLGLPFAAPFFMKIGATLPANIIYTVYKPLCHQLAFRSWFLFGEQAYYPRAAAGIENMLTYEEITNETEINIRQAQKFKGNELVGYKVALCQRDDAIYASMLLFGLIFAFSGRKIKSIKWYFWVALAIVPMGIDGVSQLPSLVGSLPAWLPIRESTPIIRSITGFLFGFFTAWYLFPVIEESMAETRTIIIEKMKYVQSLGK